jgi:site-specific DNA-cytosine methylase
MSKDQTTQPTLFQEDSHVNHSALQENGKEKMMTATSGMKLLELLPKQNQNGLLEKMLKELLTSPMVQSCNRYNKTWKKRVSKVQCLVIPASGVGAWHQRKRVWIIGCNVSNSNSNRNTNEIERSNGEKEKVQREHRQEVNSTWEFIRTNSNDVPNANSNGPYRQEGNETKQSSNQSKEWLFIKDDKNVPNSSSQRSSLQSIRKHRELEKESKRKKETRNKSSFRTPSSCPNVPNTNIKGLQGLNNKQQSSQQEQRQFTDKNNENVWNTESTGLQSSSNRQGEGKFWGTSTPGIQCQASWWEAQSKLCGIPYGLSARLDKDRTNRIKALGNSIVPLIAYEIGKAIISAEDQSD